MTPLLTTTGVLSARSSPKRNEGDLVVEGLHEDLSIGDLKSDNTNVAGGGTVRLHERRYHIPPDINISSISSHAQAEALVQKAQQDILEMALDSEPSPATGSMGRSQLSARLAAYGESLALERRLREQMDTEEGHSSSADRQPPPTSSSRAEILMPKGGTTPVIVLTRRDGVERQHSLEHRSGKPHMKFKLEGPRRPSTTEGCK